MGLVHCDRLIAMRSAPGTPPTERTAVGGDQGSVGCDEAQGVVLRDVPAVVVAPAVMPMARDSFAGREYTPQRTHVALEGNAHVRGIEVV